jgi:hypothetical protein
MKVSPYKKFIKKYYGSQDKKFRESKSRLAKVPNVTLWSSFKTSPVYCASHPSKKKAMSLGKKTIVPKSKHVVGKFATKSSILLQLPEYHKSGITHNVKPCVYFGNLAKPLTKSLLKQLPERFTTYAVTTETQFDANSSKQERAQSLHKYIFSSAKGVDDNAITMIAGDTSFAAILGKQNVYTFHSHQIYVFI